MALSAGYSDSLTPINQAEAIFIGLEVSGDKRRWQLQITAEQRRHLNALKAAISVMHPGTTPQPVMKKNKTIGGEVCYYRML